MQERVGFSGETIMLRKQKAAEEEDQLGDGLSDAMKVTTGAARGS